MRKPINGSPGLWTAANAEVLPPGALTQAKGVVLRKPGLMQKVRPYIQISHGGDYGSPLITSVCEYNGNLYMQGSSFSHFYYTPNGLTPNSAWVLIGTTATTFLCNAAIEINRVLYDGAQKIDTDGGLPYAMGVQRALDVQLTLVAAGTLLASTNSAGYRVVFGIKDAKSNLIIGPPSGRATVTATAAQNVTVKAFIPAAITSASNATSYFVQVYRTPVQTIAGVDPGEEMQLVYQAYLTSADVANKFITFMDATPDNLRGPAGYFTPSQEGIAEANYPPPAGHAFALFKNAYFVGNTQQKHRASLQLLGISASLLTISTAAGGITKSGGNGVYTFTGSPDLTNIPTDGTARLSVNSCTSAGNNGEFVITAVNTGAFTITVTNAAAVTEPGAAGARAWPSKLTIAGVVYYGTIFGAEAVGTQTFKVSTAGTPQQNVVDTCASLLRVVNQQAVPAVYGYYESGPDDGAGKMSFEAVTISGGQFSITAAGTLLYGSFNPTIPTATSVVSDNDTRVNRLYISKPNQPEHFPLASYFDIGRGTAKLLALVPLREALLVFKEDGLFRVTGDDAGNFSVSPFDLTVKLMAGANTTTYTGRAYSVLSNRAYAITNKGVMAISETSIINVSRPVANKFAAYLESTSTALSLSVLASDRDGMVYFGILGASTTLPVLQLAYCQDTNAWSEAETPDTDKFKASSLSKWQMAGFQASNGMLYRYDYLAGFVAQNDCIYREATVEQKDLLGQLATGDPLPGDLYLITVNSATATTASVTCLSGSYGAWNGGAVTADLTGCALFDPTSGGSGGGDLWLITADANPTATTKALTLQHVLGASAGGIAAGRRYLMAPQTSTVEWVPFTAGDDGSYARFREAAVTLDGMSTATAATVSMYTEATASTQTVNMTAANTPLPAGVNTQTLVRSLVPPNMQTARRLSVIFQHNKVAEYLFVRGISYEFEEREGNELT